MVYFEYFSMRTIQRKYLYYAIVLALGIGLGFLLCHIYMPKKTVSTISEIRENSSGYKYINPLLFIGGGLKTDYPEYTPVENDLNKYIISQENQKKATAISVYIRNLNDGHWTGVNEDAPYAAASMLKVAVMMAYLKQVETNPDILSKKLLFASTTNSNDIEHYASPTTLVTGREYTVRDLISSMILKSDNNANLLLVNSLDQSALTNLFEDLKLPLPSEQIDFISAKEYSRLYRTLYSSTYLLKPLSEQALDLLAHTDFNQGIVGGVPSDVVVAHKFGERSKEVNGAIAERELHDCGIVYYPNNP